jgi:hypothetical protein
LACYDRLKKAQIKWFESLSVDKREAARRAEPNLENDLLPLRLQADDKVSPEYIASVASLRLNLPKPKSIRRAVEQAFEILLAARDYLGRLPKPERDWFLTFDAELANTVSFEDILSSSGIANRIPLLPPVQAKRNDGKLTRKALEQAIRRYGSHQPKRVKQETRNALKNECLSCGLLEKIRWQRFRDHYRP